MFSGDLVGLRVRIAFNSSSTFSDANRSSFVSGMFSSTCRILSGMVPSPLSNCD